MVETWQLLEPSLHSSRSVSFINESALAAIGGSSLLLGA